MLNSVAFGGDFWYWIPLNINSKKYRKLPLKIFDEI